MNSKLEKLLADELDLPTGFAYAVPLKWYCCSNFRWE